jgi:hypothetical protein
MTTIVLKGSKIERPGTSIHLLPEKCCQRALVCISAIYHLKMTKSHLSGEGNAEFFTEAFKVDKELPNEYVKGTIFTKLGILEFYYNNRIIRIRKYKINRRQQA